MLLAGGVWHAFPELDIYGYAGQESQGSKCGFSTPSTAHTAFGWGNPFYINTGCNIEDLGGAAGAGGGGFACTGNTSLVRQATVGFWDNIYKGPLRPVGGWPAIFLHPEIRLWRNRRVAGAERKYVPHQPALLSLLSARSSLRLNRLARDEMVPQKGTIPLFTA